MWTYVVTHCCCCSFIPIHIIFQTKLLKWFISIWCWYAREIECNFISFLLTFSDVTWYASVLIPVWLDMGVACVADWPYSPTNPAHCSTRSVDPSGVIWKIMYGGHDKCTALTTMAYIHWPRHLTKAPSLSSSWARCHVLVLSSLYQSDSSALSPML